MPLQEGGAVAPDGIGCVGFRDGGGGLRVPEFLGGFDFSVGGGGGKGRDTGGSVERAHSDDVLVQEVDLIG